MWYGDDDNNKRQTLLWTYQTRGVQLGVCELKWGRVGNRQQDGPEKLVSHGFFLFCVKSNEDMLC